MSFDDANRRLTTTYAYGTADARTWSTTYKPLGQVATLAKPNGVNIAYSTSVCVNWRLRIFCFLEGALPGTGGVLWLDCLEKQRRALRGRNLPRDIRAPVRQWA